MTAVGDSRSLAATRDSWMYKTNSDCDMVIVQVYNWSAINGRYIPDIAKLLVTWHTINVTICYHLNVRTPPKREMLTLLEWTQPRTERRKNTCSFLPPSHDSTEDMKLWMYHIVTCRPISWKQVDEHVSWDTKMKGVVSRKPARCCGFNRPVHGYEHSTNIFPGYRYAI
jgi:hypothetical protein